jgi:hypothetical protein
MNTLNDLIAAFYTTNAQAQEYLRLIIAECVSRGLRLDQVLAESNKPKEETKP